MLIDGLDATSAACEVDYDDSVSQFDHEYSRFFANRH